MNKSPLPPDMLKFARELRSHQTEPEQLLWSVLRSRRLLSLKFRRQHPVPPYVLDFYCDQLKFAVELDGWQHNTVDGRTHDARRSAYLTAAGIEVLRYWNHDVLEDFEAVVQAIYNHASKRLSAASA